MMDYLWPSKWWNVELKSLKTRNIVEIQKTILINKIIVNKKHINNNQHVEKEHSCMCVKASFILLLNLSITHIQKTTNKEPWYPNYRFGSLLCFINFVKYIYISLESLDRVIRINNYKYREMSCQHQSWNKYLKKVFLVTVL